MPEEEKKAPTDRNDVICFNPPGNVYQRDAGEDTLRLPTL